MRISAPFTLLLSVIAVTVSAQSTPTCVTNCFTIKLQQSSALVPGTANDVGSLCQARQWVQALVNCFTDNCGAADIATGLVLVEQVCGIYNAPIVTSGLTGAITAYTTAFALPTGMSLPTGTAITGTPLPTGTGGVFSTPSSTPTSTPTSTATGAVAAVTSTSKPSSAAGGFRGHSMKALVGLVMIGSTVVLVL